MGAFIHVVALGPIGAESYYPLYIQAFPLYPFTCPAVNLLNTLQVFLTAGAITARQVG